MSKNCSIENMTVDAETHGNLIEVEKHDGTKEFMATAYREALPYQVFCHDCGEYMDVTGNSNIDKTVREHLNA